MIKKCGDKWCHYAADGVKLLGKFDTAAEATTHMDKMDESKKKYSHELKGREVFGAGVHNGDAYTVADLDNMVAAFKELDFSPAIKIGHAQSGSEAYGYIENLHRTGNRLIADFTHLDDATKQKIESRKLGRVSGEVYFNFKRDGKTYPRVLGAVALLGHEIPGVSGLKPLYADYSAEADVRVYVYEVPTGDDQRGNADTLKQEELYMKTLEEMQATLAANQKVLEAQQAQLKTYADEQALLKTYKQDNDILRDKMNQLKDESTKRAVKEKVAAVRIPALHDAMATLYAHAMTSAPRVKHYSTSAKKAEDVDLTEVLDQMVEHLNTKIVPLTKTYSKHDAASEPVDADNSVDAGKEIDRLVKVYMAEKKVDYATAFTAVSREQPDLARIYGT